MKKPVIKDGCVGLQVANAYGCGLTDWDMASLYGKLCIFAFAAWGSQSGGVTAGLAVCGVMLSVTSAAAGETHTWSFSIMHFAAYLRLPLGEGSIKIFQYCIREVAYMFHEA